MPYATRIARVRAQLPAWGVDAFLTFQPANRRYLSGFTGTSGYVLLTPAETLFLTDARYTEQARAQCRDHRVVEHEREFWTTLRRCLGELGCRRVGFEKAHVTVSWLERAQERIEQVEWVGTEGLVDRLRLIKDDAEIAAVRRAQTLTDEVFLEVLEQVRPGASERELALELQWRLVRRGAEDVAFPSIVASGERSALPHGVASDRKLARGDLVTFDFGAMVDGYASDMTRTVVVGEPSTEQRRVHDVVRRARDAGMRALRPGRTGREVDAEARRVIEEAGYGDHFGHGLGHGVGLEVHEGPRLSRLADDVLESGMVVTVEPGVYIPGWGGVRIEDMVVVRPDGAEVLPRSPRDLAMRPAAR